MLSETPILLQHPLKVDESGAWLENCNITPDSWQLRSAAETLNHSNKYSLPKIPSPQKFSHHPECLQIAVIMWYDWDTRHIVMSTSWHQHQLPHQMLANNILILRNKIWDSWLVPDDPSPKSLMEHTDYNWINSDHCRQALVSLISIMKNWNNNIQ